MTRSNEQNKTDGGATILRTVWTDRAREYYTTYFQNRDGSFSKVTRNESGDHHADCTEAEAKKEGALTEAQVGRLADVIKCRFGHILRHDPDRLFAAVPVTRLILREARLDSVIPRVLTPEVLNSYEEACALAGAKLCGRYTQTDFLTAVQLTPIKEEEDLDRYCANCGQGTCGDGCDQCGESENTEATI
jgi:hypothetical protein